MKFFDWLFPRKAYPKSKIEQKRWPSGGLVGMSPTPPCGDASWHALREQFDGECRVCRTIKTDRQAVEALRKANAKLVAEAEKRDEARDERLEMITDRLTEKVIQRLRDEGLI